MLANELKEILRDADANTLRIVRAARDRDVTILLEYLNAGVSHAPCTDSVRQIEREILDMGPPPVSAARTYIIDRAGQWITCLRCDRTSYNQSDIAEKFCGHCHHFHEL
jgi:hypothetical protein